MSQSDDALVKASPTSITIKRQDPAELQTFEAQAVNLHHAIEEDKESIEAHLAVLQVELERGMDRVADVRDKALEVKARAMEVKEDVHEKVDQAKQHLERVKDWKGIVRDYPLHTVGAGLAIGFYFGSMLRE